MSVVEKRCPDCQSLLGEILLFDRTYPVGSELQYGKTREKAATIRTPSGTVKGWMCPDCRRILLYGEPLGGAT